MTPRDPVVYNARQRAQMYRSMRRIIDRLERDDAEVASRDVRPDGYPSGGEGGRRRNGHSDPTYSVVVRILGGEATGSLVEQYYGLLHMCSVQLEEADSRRAALLPPEASESVSDDEWCQNCLKLVQRDHKGNERRLCSPVWRDGATVCGFCRDWYRDYKEWPGKEILKRHADGKRIYRKEKAG